MNYRLTAFLCILMIFLSMISCSKEEQTTQNTVKQLPATEESSGPASPEVMEGAKMFEQNCRVCHGEGGKGDICPDLTDNVWKYGNSDEQLFRTISGGRPGGMPNWGNKLSEKQISDLIAYIRSIGE